jgi:hypothetical protein
MCGNPKYVAATGQRPERQVDVEAGAPGPVVGQPSPERRPENSRHAEQRRKQALVTAAFRRREDVANDGEQDAARHAGADALESSERNQLAHPVQREERQRAGCTAQRRGHHEERGAKHEERLAPEPVRQAGEDRHRHRVRQQIDGRDPGIAIESRQRRDDARFCGADNGLIDRRKQRGQEQTRQRAN